jgi:hypothetical protein
MLRRPRLAVRELWPYPFLSDVWYVARRACHRGDGMPNPAALIAVLIMERPLCVACISSKSKLTTGEVESYLNRIEGRVAVLRGVDRCRACFASTTVCSLIRRD